MKKKILHLLIAFISSLLVPYLAQAQQMMQFDASNSFLFEEFQTMMQEEDGAVIVRIRLGNPNETSADQLQQNDVIIMMNGERINKISDVRNIYEALDTGEEIKMGVRRGEERFILTAVKGDVPEGNRNFRTVISTQDSGDAPPMIPALGLVLSNVNGQIVIDGLLDPLVPDEISKLQLKQGDKLLKIGDSELTDADDAVNMVDEISEGEKLTLVFEQNGREVSVTLEKPAAPMNVDINIDE